MSKNEKNIKSKFEEYSEKTSNVDISDTSIASSIVKTVLNTPGVNSMSGRFYDGVVDGISSKLGQKYEIGVNIKKRKDNAYEITIFIIAEYGVKLIDLAQHLQAKITDLLYKMFGINIAFIKVKIEGLADILEENSNEQKNES